MSTEELEELEVLVKDDVDLHTVLCSDSTDRSDVQDDVEESLVVAVFQMNVNVKEENRNRRSETSKVLGLG